MQPAHPLFVEDERSSENQAVISQMQNDGNCLCFPQTHSGGGRYMPGVHPLLFEAYQASD